MSIARIERVCRNCGTRFFSPKPDPKYCNRQCYLSRPTRPESERFWSHVDKSRTCWLWTGAVNETGYGVFKTDDDIERAHRYSYQLRYGPIAPGVMICHNCPTGDNPACVNPDHLWAGTAALNSADMVAKGRVKRGSTHYMAKLNENTALQIYQMAHEGIQHRKIAAHFNVSQQCVSAIVTGVSWRHATKHPNR